MSLLREQGMNLNRSFSAAAGALVLILALPAARADEPKGATPMAPATQGEKIKDKAKDPALKSGHNMEGHGASPADPTDTEHQHGSKAVDETAKPAGPPAPAKADATKAKSEPKVTYVCPMHPEVTSDKKDRCPKCNMFLEPKK